MNNHFFCVKNWSQSWRLLEIVYKPMYKDSKTTLGKPSWYDIHIEISKFFNFWVHLSNLNIQYHIFQLIYLFHF